MEAEMTRMFERTTTHRSGEKRELVVAEAKEGQLRLESAAEEGFWKLVDLISWENQRAERKHAVPVVGNLPKKRI